MAPKNYCTPDDIKILLPDQDWGEQYTNLLGILVERASRAIDTFCRRMPGAFAADVDSIEYFSGGGGLELWVGEMAAAPTTVQVSENGDLSSYTTWAATDYHTWPWNASKEENQSGDWILIGSMELGRFGQS